ncbi:MAG: HAMP domain-containing sensor histidine kinase [Prolixibacteraceae bacterium]
MKLIRRTYNYTALSLIPIVILGSLFCYYMIEYISYEETDEFLTYEMQRLIDYHRENNDLPEFHQVTDIIAGVRYDAPMFKDTMILESGDNEMVPYRELYFTISHKGQDQTLVLRHLLIGRDDIAEGTILIIAGLMILITVILYLIVNYMAGKIWTPFYTTLDKLVRFKISGPLPEFPDTDIDEFKSLNTTLKIILGKISADYRHNKEFSENSSHELQTHLAVIRATTERLLNNQDAAGYAAELQKVYVASNKLSQVQKSLLLLSKINNREYSNAVEIDLRFQVDQSLRLFEEAIAIREVTVTSQMEPCALVMDMGLAEILTNNLIKNAVKHNVQGGRIRIVLTPAALTIENSGADLAADATSMLERFAKGKNGNIGIGLAIVKQICELYHFNISYEVTEESTHRVIILFG